MLRKCFQYSIYLVDFPEIGGSVQQGLRPAICCSNDASNIFSEIGQFLPLTTQEKCNLPTHYTLFVKDYPFLKHDSIVMGEQISTLPQDKVISFLGRLKKEDLNGIKGIICEQFSL